MVVIQPVAFEVFASWVGTCLPTLRDHHRSHLQGSSNRLLGSPEDLNFTMEAGSVTYLYFVSCLDVKCFSWLVGTLFGVLFIVCVIGM
jgi:hypothetical protein